MKESEHLKCVLLDRLEFACLAYIHSGKCHMCTNEERLSMSQEIYLRSTLVKMVDSTLEVVYYEGKRALKMCAVGYQ